MIQPGKILPSLLKKKSTPTARKPQNKTPPKTKKTWKTRIVIRSDRFKSYVNFPRGLTLWRIHNTGNSDILWAGRRDPPSEGEGSYQTLPRKAVDVPILFPRRLYMKRDDEDQEPIVEIIYTITKDPKVLARLASGLSFGEVQVVTQSTVPIETRTSFGAITGTVTTTVPTTVENFMHTLASGVLTQLNSYNSKTVAIQALSGNTGTVFLGATSAKVSVGTAHEIYPRGAISINIDNPSKLLARSTISGDKISTLVVG